MTGFLNCPRGYADNFNTDLGWQVSGDAANGIWTREVPFGTSHTNDEGVTTVYNPLTDSPWDEGGRCYVTGNTPVNNIHEDQVDDGITILTSPIMELASRYNRPFLQYDMWWYTTYSKNAPNDTLRVFLTNGADTVMLEEYDGLGRRMQEWQQIPEYDLENLITITDEMQFILTIGDEVETPNVIEAALDNFLVAEGSQTSNTRSEESRMVEVHVFPNPFKSGLTVEYVFEKDFSEMQMAIVNILGQQMDNISLKEKSGKVQLETNYPSGAYFLYFMADGESGGVVKVLKF